MVDCFGWLVDWLASWLVGWRGLGVAFGWLFDFWPIVGRFWRVDGSMVV